MVFYPPSQLLAFHRNQQGSTCETSVVRGSTPTPCVTLHVDEAGRGLSEPRPGVLRAALFSGVAPCWDSPFQCSTPPRSLLLHNTGQLD